MRLIGGKALFVFALVFLALAARDARAQQLDVTAAPNPVTIAAGSSQTISVMTHSNASTPATATSVDYTLSITPDFAGGSTTITTNTPQTSTRTGNPAPNDWTPVSITITVPANAVPGNYSGPLTGRYQYAPGQYTNYEFLVVNVTVTGGAPPQDFTVTATPSSVSMSPGGLSQVVFTASGTNGFSGTITVNVPPLPNATITPSPQFTLQPGQSQTVTFTAPANASPGTNTANFSATATVNGSAVNKLVPVTVTVTAPAPDFTLSAAPPVVTMSPGAQQTVTVSLTPLNGFNSSVTVNATSSNPDLTVTPASFSISPTQPQAVTLAVKPTANGGNTTVTFTSASKIATVSATILQPVAQADFNVSVVAVPPQLAPGQSGQLNFTVVPINNFNGTVSIAAPSLPNFTFSPNPLTMTPGTKTMSVTAGAGAQPGTLPLLFTATSGTLQHVTQTPITITPIAAGTPTITAVVPPALVRGAAAIALHVIGTNFAAGAQVTSDSPLIQVQSTTVLSPTAATVVVRALNNADLTHPYTLRLTNPGGATTPNGAQLFVYDQDAIGAPLAVRTAAIVSPIEGTLVAANQAIYPRGLVAVSGSGILHGQWRLDGVAYESFDVNATAGMPVEVRGRVKIPLAAWGDHELSLAVATNLQDLATSGASAAVSAPVTIISTIESANQLTIFAPRDAVVIGKQIPTFRWSLVPGASGYVIEFGTRTNPAQQRVTTAESEWTPTREQLRNLRKTISGIVLWRVRAMFPGDVPGEPTAPRAIVILPDEVTLNGKAVMLGGAQWEGGSDGVLYHIDVLGERGRLFSAVAFHQQYVLPRFARAQALALRVRPASPMGDSLGRSITIELPPAPAADAPATTVTSVSVTPVNGASVDTTQPHISATWNGNAAAKDVTLFIDETDVTPVSAITSTSIVYDSLLPLTPGTHTAKLAVGATVVNWSFVVAPAAAPSPAAPVPATVTPLHTDYTLAPNGTISWVHEDKSNAHVQISGQGDIERPGGVGTKFTGDLAYKGINDPNSLRQESRNYVAQGSAAQGSLSEEAKFGYTTPDFTNGAEFLTSGLARTGVNAKVSVGGATLSYYQPIDTAIHGVLSGNDLNLHIRSAGLSTPDGRAYQLRAIALDVDDPGQGLQAGSRLRTLGLFGNWNVNQALQLTGEFAHGSVRPECGNLTDADIISGAVCPTAGRSGSAMRLGFAGVVKNTTYGLVLRHVDTNFVNPANRGLTNGGIADRTSADLNLGRQFGLTGISLTLRRQEAGRSHDSPQPRASQTGANVSLNRMFGQHLNANVGGMLSQDRGLGLAATGLPATHRSQNGLNGTLTEMFGGGYSLSESLGWQKMLDHINSLSNQTSSNANLTFSGSVRPNLMFSANAGMTHTVAAPVIGTTNQYIASVQPSLAIPKWFLSIAPRIGYNRSQNAVTHFTSSGGQYAAVLQFSPTWASSLVSGQASAEWDKNDADAPLVHTRNLMRRYQASLNIRWGGLHAGAAAVPPPVLPGAAPQLPPASQQAAPAASH